jgi:hypothetical protein
MSSSLNTMTVCHSLLFLCLSLASRLGKRLEAGGGLLDAPVQDTAAAAMKAAA